MAELSFMSVDPDVDHSNLEMDIEIKDLNSTLLTDLDESISKLDKIEFHMQGFMESSEREPGTEILEICEDTVNPNGKVNAEDFKIVKVIGKGGYGTVFLVQKATESKDEGKFYAMKVLKKAKLICNEKNKAHTVSERNILEVLKHPFLVRLHYAFQNRSNLYIVLEYCPGGELFRYLEREGFLMEDAACFYISEIALAIGHLHSLGIIYRDLKPENILLDRSGHVKLTDFGLSKEGVCMTNTFCGTIEYMAPEIIRCAGHGKAVDWWSLGTLLFDMLSGGPPFSQEGNKKATAEKILKNHVKFPPSFSTEAISLIRGLLKKDPKDRLGSKNDVEEIKQHRFFQRYEVNWVDVFERKLEPPFRPELSSESDVSMFDPTFTGLQPVVSPSNADDVIPADLFQGFSFVAASVADPPRAMVPELRRGRGHSRRVVGATTIGRLCRPSENSPHSMTNHVSNATNARNGESPEHDLFDANLINNIHNEVLMKSVTLNGVAGCDLSDFASNTSCVSMQNSADGRNLHKYQPLHCIDDVLGTPEPQGRILSSFLEEDEYVPGAKYIENTCHGNFGFRNVMFKPIGEKCRPSNAENTIILGNKSKKLSDLKPLSSPNLRASMNPRENAALHAAQSFNKLSAHSLLPNEPTSQRKMKLGYSSGPANTMHVGSGIVHLSQGQSEYQPSLMRNLPNNQNENVSATNSKCSVM